MSTNTLTSNSHVHNSVPPISFAKAASKAPTNPVSIATPSTSLQPISSNLPQLKRWPKKADPQVLRKLLEEELKDKNRLALFTEISGPKGQHKVVILLRGVPGSGKSLLSTLLLGVSDGGVSLSADSHFVDARGVYKFNPNELGVAHGQVQKQCQKTMAAGTSPIVIDNTNTMSTEMMPYVKMAITYGYQVRLLEPITTWKTNAKILSQKNVHGVPFQKIKHMIERFETGLTAERLIHMAREEMKKQDNLLASLGRLRLN